MLTNGSTQLRLRIRNSVATALSNVEVSDVLARGSATVSSLTCDFSLAVTGGPTSGTTWAGPFPAGAQFSCTADLTGVSFGDPHTDDKSRPVAPDPGVLPTTGSDTGRLIALGLLLVGGGLIVLLVRRRAVHR